MYAPRQNQIQNPALTYPGVSQLSGCRFDFCPPTQEKELFSSSWPAFDAEYAIQAISAPPEPPAIKPASSFTSDQPSSLLQELEKKTRRASGHIPRPRNSFMIFRCEFDKLPGKIEHDNRHISRIIAHCWKCLPEAEKQHWRNRAVEEKLEHERKYPDYRYHPAPRGSKKVKRRNVRRNGENDIQRCRRVAELLINGARGGDLENEVEKIDKNTQALAIKEFEQAYEFKVNLPSLGEVDEAEKVARIYDWIQNNILYLGSENSHSQYPSLAAAGRLEQGRSLALNNAKYLASGSSTPCEQNIDEPNQVTNGDAIFDHSLNQLVIPSQQRRNLNSDQNLTTNGWGDSTTFYSPAQTVVPSQQAVIDESSHGSYQLFYPPDICAQKVNTHYSVEAQGRFHYYETSPTSYFPTQYYMPGVPTPHQFTQPVYQ